MRTAHPDADLAEIEQAVDQLLSGYRAALITQVAVDLAPEGRPDCPDYGVPLRRVGRQTRRMATAYGGELCLTDVAWRCPACKAGLSPPL